MRKQIVAGNWKMNLNYLQGVSLFSEIVNMAADELRANQQLVICSPFVHLQTLAHLAKGKQHVAIGAQNIYHENAGAYTGEISAEQVSSTGAQFVIIGHSERRAYFHEDAFVLSKKVKLALDHGLKVIYCVGESEDERREERHFKVIEAQLKDVIGFLNPQEFKQIVIAYEPVWAIGTGLTATPEQAQEVHEFIRHRIAGLFDGQTAIETSILYGGSCNTTNARQLFSKPDIDGGLIGGASLKSRDFIEIAKVFNDIKR